MTDQPKKSSPKAEDSKKNKDVDRQVEDSFPASDPPSYAGGKHIVGEPQRSDKKDEKNRV